MLKECLKTWTINNLYAHFIGKAVCVIVNLEAEK